MKRLFVKENYKSLLSLLETEKAIKFIKDNFENKLAEKLNLTRVSAPLIILPSTGLNDELNGIEERVSFNLKNIDEHVEIIQSLAKWKRNALKKYAFKDYEGLYCDMNAIRKDEDLDSLHSCYVDQWDWEKIIKKEDRNQNYLKNTVKEIYAVIKETELLLAKYYPILKPCLPDDIFFITTSELEEMYPLLKPIEREREICKLHKAVFLMQIGKPLKNNLPHDGRAADYDDWNLNGDILVYYEELDIAFELSSMGIRVDENSIVEQLEFKKEEYKLGNVYVQNIINKKLPYTIGGGIGQSRLCMFLLKKMHIGEVQSSIWEENDLDYLAHYNIHLL